MTESATLSNPLSLFSTFMVVVVAVINFFANRSKADKSSLSSLIEKLTEETRRNDIQQKLMDELKLKDTNILWEVNRLRTKLSDTSKQLMSERDHIVATHPDINRTLDTLVEAVTQVHQRLDTIEGVNK